MEKILKHLGLSQQQHKAMMNEPKNRRTQEKQVQYNEVEIQQVQEEQNNYQLPQYEKIEELKVPIKDDFIAKIHQFQSPDCELVDFQLLYEIFKKVAKKGGIINAFSIGKFAQIAQDQFEKWTNINQINEELSNQAIQLYQNIIFTYEFLQRNGHLANKLYKVGMVNFVGIQNLSYALANKEEGLQYFNQDLTLFQKGAKAMKFDEKIFNCEYMADHYGNQKMDIRVQNPCDYGFKPHLLKNKSYSMPLKDYRFYQLNLQNAEKMKNFKHLEYIKDGHIFFGVNFEPSDNMLNEQVKKRCNNTFLDFYADFDLLSYMDQDVPGCSIPQLYFKTRGCWTGGHQENVCMSALNINHGPGYSQWFTLQLNYVQELRAQLIKQFNMDLYQCQGLWYENLDWFIERNYPVKRFLQRKNDIVVTGPGTLHWVRSFGTALQTSWNMFPKTYQQFKAAYHRQQKNQQIQFRKSDIIPLKALTIKYLNHEKKTMPKNIRELCLTKLKEWIQKQEKYYKNKKYDFVDIKTSYIPDTDTFCQECAQEVVMFYFPPKNENKRGVLCLGCELEQMGSSRKKIKIQNLHKKYQTQDLQQLIFECQQEQVSNSKEIKALCIGEHIGRTPCEYKKQKTQPFIEQPEKQETKIFVNQEQFAQINQNQMKMSLKMSRLEQMVEKLCESQNRIEERLIAQQQRRKKMIEENEKRFKQDEMLEKGKKLKGRERERSRHDQKKMKRHSNRYNPGHQFKRRPNHP